MAAGRLWAYVAIARLARPATDAAGNAVAAIVVARRENEMDRASNRHALDEV
jgi:Na+/H+-dicarboxylate symporter